jgi:HSP20 family protein
MDWKKIAPWNWFKEEETPALSTAARAGAGTDPLASFRTEMERMFEESVRRLLPQAGGAGDEEGAASLLRPSIDISEGRKAYTVSAELPGVEADDVSIEIEDQTLVIRAEKRSESDEEEEGYHWVERSYGVAQRVLSLPDDAEGDKVEARFRNGVLKLRIPKRPARASRARSVEVQTG